MLVCTVTDCVFNVSIFCEECGLWGLVLDTLSKSDGSLSLNVSTGHGRIEFKEQSLHVEGM